MATKAKIQKVKLAQDEYPTARGVRLSLFERFFQNEYSSSYGSATAKVVLAEADLIRLTSLAKTIAKELGY